MISEFLVSSLLKLTINRDITCRLGWNIYKTYYLLGSLSSLCGLGIFKAPPVLT